MKYFCMTFFTLCVLSTQSLFAQPAGYEFNAAERITYENKTFYSDIDNPSITYSNYEKKYDINFEMECDGLIQIFKMNMYVDDHTSSPSLIETNTTYNIDPVLEKVGSDVMHVWTGNSDQDGQGIFANSFGYFSSSTGTFQVNEYYHGTQSKADIATDGTNAFIVWQSDNADTYNSAVCGRLVDPDGTFITDEFIINTFTTRNQMNPAIACNGSKYLVVWASERVLSSSGTWYRYGISGQFFDNDGTPIGSEFIIAEDNSNHISLPEVVSDGTDFMVVCSSINVNLYAVKVSENGTVGGLQILTDSFTANSTYISIASSGNNYMALWKHNTQNQIMAQMLNSDGTLFGSSFQVNNLSGITYDLSVASDGDGYAFLWINSVNATEADLHVRYLDYTGLNVIAEPSSKVYSDGDIVNFNVTAESEYPPIHYQWYLDGNEVGIDSPTLTLTGLTEADDEKTVVCTVSDQYKEITTNDGVKVIYQKLSNGYALHQDFFVSQSVAEKGNNVALASNGTDYFTAWDMINTSGTTMYDVYGLSYDNSGTAIGTRTKLNTIDDYNQVKPDIVFNGTYYLAVWQSYVFGQMEEIVGQFYNSAGVPVGTEFVINTTHTYAQKNPAVATDGTNFFVVWETYGQDSDGYAIAGCLIHGTTLTVATEIIINQWEAGSQTEPDIACDGSKYLVVWEDDGDYSGDTGFNIIGRYVSLMGTLTAGNDFMINEHSYDMHKPAVASASGNFCVVWESYSSGNPYEIKMRYIPAYGEMHDERGVSSEYRKQYHPAIASNGYDFIITWVYEDYSNPIELHAKRLYYDGTPISEFIVAIANQGGIQTPGLTSNGKDFMLCWTSANEFGISQGVYGKLLTYQGPMFSRDCADKSAYVNEDVSTMVLPFYAHGPVSYQWYYKGSAYGTNSNRVELPDVQLADNDSAIYCAVTDLHATKNTRTATLNVNEFPVCYEPNNEVMLDTDSTLYQKYPELFASGSQFRTIFFGTDGSTYGDGVKSRLFDELGTPQGSSVYYGSLNAFSVPETLKVAFNGTHYLAVYSDDFFDGYVKGHFFDASGNPVGSAITISQTNLAGIPNLDIATDGSTFFVTWSGEEDNFNDPDGVDVYARIVNSDGTFATSELIIHQASGTQKAPVVAYNGTCYLVVWSVYTGSSNYELRAQMYMNDGTKLYSEFVASSSSAVYREGADIIAIGSDYYVTWIDTSRSLWFQKINVFGTLVGSAVQVTLPDEAPYAYNPVICASDHDFLIAWEDSNSDYDANIYAQLFNMSGDSLGTPFIINTHLNKAQNNIEIASDGTNYALCWMSYKQDDALYTSYIKTLKYAGPQITEQPVNTTVHEGHDTQLMVNIGHSHGTSTYRWYKQTTARPLMVGTARILYLDDVPYSDDGSVYYCVINDDDGQTVSQIVTLTVTPKLAITVHPYDQTTYTLEPVSFSVKTNYKDNVSYQWYHEATSVDVIVSGATEPTFTIEHPTIGMDGNEYFLPCNAFYRCSGI